MSGDWAAELESVSTAVAAVAAITAGAFAGIALRSQALFTREQSRVLSLQSAEIAQAAVARRREQAAQVFIDHSQPTGTDYGLFPIEGKVVNASRLPIYETVTFAVQGGKHWSGAGAPNASLDRIGPGDEKPFSGVLDVKDYRSFGVVVYAVFTDAAGIRWLIARDGTLMETDDSGKVTLPIPRDRSVRSLWEYEQKDIERERQRLARYQWPRGVQGSVPPTDPKD